MIEKELTKALAIKNKRTTEVEIIKYFFKYVLKKGVWKWNFISDILNQ